MIPGTAGTGTGSGPQTVTATITPGVGYNVGTPSSATATVLTQRGRIYFFLDKTQIEATEGTTSFASFQIKARTQPGVPKPNGPFRFEFATNSVTATRNSDYTHIVGTILFRSNNFSASGSIFEAFQLINIPILNDTAAEPPETFNGAVTRFTGDALTDPTPSTVSRYDALTGLTCTDCATATTVLIFDDDASPAVLVTDAANLQTGEDGTTDTFKVKLATKPSADVSIALTSSDTGEGTVSPTPLTFTSANWYTDQTVTITGVDDTDRDRDQSYQITFAATSTDTDYSGITVSPVSVTNTDDEAQALQLTVNAVTDDDIVNIQEKADGFAMTGQSMTVEGVAITVVIGARGNLTGTSDSGGNWSVAVPANASYVTEGTLDITVSATKVRYEAPDLTHQVTVDLTKPTVQSARVAGAAITLTYNETLDATSIPDGTAYSVKVNSSTVALATTNPVAINGSVVTVTLASAVNTVDTVTIDYTPPTGMDASPVRDAAGNPADSLTGQDVIGIGVLITDADNPQTGEDGSTDTFKVKLATIPSAAVSIALMSSDTGEGTVSPTPLTFTTTNWDTDQTVTLTGVDDTDDDDQSYQITFAVTSTDTDYNVITVSPVSVTNTDDEVSSDATLSGLTLADPDANTIDLSHTFTASRKGYTVTAPVGAWRVVVTPTVKQEDATFEFLDENDALLTDADTDTADFDVDVPIGQSVVKAKVTAEDSSEETYTIPGVDFLAKTLDQVHHASTVIPYSGHSNLFYRFCTGPATNGYTLTDVTLEITTATDQPFNAAIYVPRGFVGGRFGAGSKVGDLTGSLSPAGQIILHAVTPINLDPNTHYGLGLRLPSGSVALSRNVVLATALLDDGTGPGWSFDNVINYHNNPVTLGTQRSSTALRMKLAGRSAAGDDTLSALTVSKAKSLAVPLDPTFAPGVDNYTASAGPDVTSVVINPTANRSDDATIEYLDEDDAILADADTNDPDFDLSLGDNIVKVRVTAPNGVDQRVYTINVERKAHITVATDHERIVNKLHVPTFTLTRNGPRDQALDVTVSLDNVGSGDAISSAPKTGTATFATNSATAEFTPLAFWFRGSSSGEFTVSLVVPDTHTGDSVTVTALDVSTAVTVSFEQDAYQVQEGAGTLNLNLKAVTIDDIPVPNQSFNVSVSTQQGTAGLTADYTGFGGNLTFEPSAWTAESNHHVALLPQTVYVVDDSVYESRTGVNEHCLLRLQGTGGTPAIIKLDPQAVSGSQVEIIDDETLNITTTLAKAF